MNVQSQVPSPYSVRNSTFQSVAFEVVDAAGVDASTVIIWVDGHIVWQGDADYGTDNYTVTKSVVTNGFKYSILKDGWWVSKSQVVFKVYAVNVGATATITEQWWIGFGSLLVQLYDEFDGAVPSIEPGSLGTGLYTVGSSRLHVEMPSGSNGDWYTFGRNGNMPYHYPLSLRKDLYANVAVETEAVTHFTANSSVSHSMWGLWQDNANWYMIYTHDGSTWNTYKCIANTWTWIAGVSAPVPRKLRFYLDLIAGTIQWQYHNGSAWVDINAAQTLQITPSRVFWYDKNWNSFPRVYTEYSYLYVTAEGLRSLKDTDNINMTFKVRPFDKESYPPMRGTAKHTFPMTPAGIRPGFPRAQDGSVVLASISPSDSLTDSVTYPGNSPQSLVRSRFSQPETGAAIQIPGTLAPSGYRPGPTQTSSMGDVARFPLLSPLRIGGRPVPRTHRHWNEPFHGFPSQVAMSLQKTGSVGGTQHPSDEKRLALGIAPNYRADTYDSELHPHFIGRKIKRACYYDRTGEPWSNPTTNNLTGYAANGLQYLNGVATGGQAPWATEIANNDRSSRFTFPVRTLTVIGYDELVVFDLDNYPAVLDVWMRFRIGPSGTFYMLGRIQDSLEDVKWSNGTLVVCSVHNGTENGALFSIDFKQTDQKCALLIRNDNHWWYTSGKTIRDRHNGNWWTLTGAGSALRIQPTSAHFVAASYDKRPVGSDWRRQWLAVNGNAPFTIIETYNNVPVYDYDSTGSAGRTWYTNRSQLAHIDKSGWLWHTDNVFLFRNVYDYQTGVIVGDTDNANDNIYYQYRTEQPRDGNRHMRYAYAKLPDTILWLDDSDDLMFVGTTNGIYIVNRYSMEWWLAYTIAGGGGGGINNIVPQGELGIGRNNLGRHVHCIGTPYASFVEWANGIADLGAVTLIRISNNFVLGQFQHPILCEEGAYFAFSVLA